MKAIKFLLAISLLFLILPALSIAKNDLPIHYDRIKAAAVNKGYVDSKGNIINYSNVFVRLDKDATYEIKAYSTYGNACVIFRIYSDYTITIEDTFSNYLSFTPKLDSVYGITCIPSEKDKWDNILIIVEKLPLITN